MKTKKKILVVDDQAMVRVVLRKILIKEGYKVLCARDGETAIKKIENEKFDLVLLDLKMPGIDGMETLERIRKINKNIRVILISGYLTNEKVERATKLGISNYIRKPFNLDELTLKKKKALIKRND